MKIVSMGPMGILSRHARPVLYEVNIELSSIADANKVMAFLFDNSDCGLKGGIVADPEFGNSAKIYFQSDDELIAKILNLVYGAPIEQLSEYNSSRNAAKENIGGAKLTRVDRDGSQEKYEISVLLNSSEPVNSIERWLLASISCLYFEVWSERDGRHMAIARFNGKSGPCAYLVHLSKLNVDVSEATNEMKKHFSKEKEGET